MRSLAVIVIFFSVVVPCLSQGKSETSPKIRNASLIDSSRIAALERVAQTQEEIIKKQSTVIQQWNIFAWVVGIWITALSVGLPLAIYFTTIRPAQSELKGFRKKMDKRVASYLLSHKQKLISGAIDVATGSAAGNKLVALESLRTHSVEKSLSEEHLFSLGSHLMTIISEADREDECFYIIDTLGSQRSKQADHFLRLVLRTYGQQPFRQLAYEYFAVYDQPTLVSLFGNWLNTQQANHIAQTYLNELELLSESQRLSPGVKREAISEIINTNEIIERLFAAPNLQEFKNQFDNIHTPIVTAEVYQSSILGKKLNSTFH